MKLLWYCSHRHQVFVSCRVLHCPMLDLRLERICPSHRAAPLSRCAIEHKIQSRLYTLSQIFHFTTKRLINTPRGSISPFPKQSTWYTWARKKNFLAFHFTISQWCILLFKYFMTVTGCTFHLLFVVWRFSSVCVLNIYCEKYRPARGVARPLRGAVALWLSSGPLDSWK